MTIRLTWRCSRRVDALRPANFYRVEWAADNAVCAAALSSLNKPFATPLDLRTAQDATGAPMGARDYGFTSGGVLRSETHDNVRWSWRKIDAGTPIESEIAFVDFFNDGVERLVLRTRGARAGDYVIDFAVRNADGAGPLLESLNYARAGAAHGDLPDQDNLRSKLSRSVKDLISLKKFGIHTDRTAERLRSVGAHLPCDMASGRRKNTMARGGRLLP